MLPIEPLHNFMRHSKIKILLYDYLQDEIDLEMKKEVEAHLTGCVDCRREMDELKEMLQAFSPAAFDASTGRSADYWAGFASSVEERIAGESRLPARRR